jgi:hypothetical protein
MRSLLLVASAVVVGLSAWSGEALALPIAMLFPALWALAPSRWMAAVIAAGYFLAASHGLPQGVMNFYGSGIEAGIGLWIASSLSFVAVHAVFWTRRRGWRSAIRYAIAAVLLSVPPLGIVGWAHPITGAGVIFPGWGWAGLAAATISLLVMTTKRWPVAILTLGGLWTWSAVTWTLAPVPDGWIGLDTDFGGIAGSYVDYEQQMMTIALVKTAADEGAKVVVLPESALGIWTSTTDRWWRRELLGRDVTVLGGAIVLNDIGYDNVMVMVSASGSRLAYAQRMPVPVSMWQPWTTGGARADFFANPAMQVAGINAAPLLCYELLVIWPVIQSVIYSPETLVAIGNGWWTDGTNIVSIQRATIDAWGRLFGLATVGAFNR